MGGFARIELDALEALEEVCDTTLPPLVRVPPLGVAGFGGGRSGNSQHNGQPANPTLHIRHSVGRTNAGSRSRSRPR